MNNINKRKQYKRLVRYMKRWRDHNFNNEAVRKKIFSIGLTVMLKEQFKPSMLSECVDNDLQELKASIDGVLNSNYIREFHNGKRLFVRLPKEPYRDIFQHKDKRGEVSISVDGSDLNVGSQFYNKLKLLQSNLQKAIDEADEIKQCEILNKVFGDDFKIPKKNDSDNTSKALAGSAMFSSSGATGTSQGA